MDTKELQQCNRFHVYQKEKLTVLTYRIFTDEDGKPGELVAFAQEKKWAFKEEVTIYADEGKETILAKVKSTKVPEASNGRAVATADDQPIGVFGQQLSKSVAKTTWIIEQEGLPRLTVRERDSKSAGFRRAWKLVQPDWLEVPFMFKYHFDVLLDDQVIGAVEKEKNFEEQYLVRVEDDRLNRLLMIGMTIILDVEQYRAI